MKLINWIKNNPLLSKDKLAGYGAVLFALLTSILANADTLGLPTTVTGTITTVLALYKILTSDNIREYWIEKIEEEQYNTLTKYLEDDEGA